LAGKRISCRGRHSEAEPPVWAEAAAGGLRSGQPWLFIATGLEREQPLWPKAMSKQSFHAAGFLPPLVIPRELGRLEGHDT